jgi:trk system potassium uptake protein TrkH
MKLINPLIIIRILSTILLIETLLFITCVPVALVFEEAILPFLLSSIIAGFIYLALSIISRNADKNKISKRDGFITVTLSWIIFSALGSLPYLVSGTANSFIDAFFESASGFTTTGATIFADVEILPRSILFWRSLTHWIGGLGIIVLVIIILPSLKILGYQLFSLELSLKEKIHPKTKGIGYRILFIYVGLTVTEIILLNLGNMTLFDSICYTFGTVATGGFSTRNTGLMYYSSYNQYIIMIFMFLAGVSQIIYYYFIKLNFRRIKQNSEFWFYLLITIIAGTTATLILFRNTASSPEAAFREGFFNVISIITTTGYASSDFLYWPVAGQILLFLLLFTGASTGSTTGSIKIARHLIVIKNIKSVFVRLIHPNAVSSIKINGRLLSGEMNISILSFIVLYLFIFAAGTILIAATGSDPVTAASSVAASLGNIGPGLGMVGPMSNYSHMPEISKLILSLLMIIGRLEIITILSIFSRSFWKL